MTSDSLRALLIRAHIVLLYKTSTIFRRRRWFIVSMQILLDAFDHLDLYFFFLSFFRRRTVILAIAAISVLVISGVIVGLAFGLQKRKKDFCRDFMGIFCYFSYA